MTKAELLHLQDDYAMATYRDVFVIIWRHLTTIETCRLFRRELVDFGKKRSKGIALLTIVEERAPMPPTECRQSIAETLRDASDHILASAVVFEGEGFRAAAVRSVVAGLNMLARQKFPHKVFSDISEAGSWMHATVGTTLEQPFLVGAVERAINELRASIATETP
jgi:hypothetical protein